MSDTRLLARRISTLVGLTALGVGAFVWLTRSAEQPKPRPRRDRAQAVRVLEAAELVAVPRVTGYGEVAPERTWQAVAEIGGTVVETGPDVQVGRVVREGTVLFRIDPEQAELDKQRTLATVKGVRAQLAELKAREQSAKATLAVEKKSLELARKNLETTQDLYREGNVSRSEVETAEGSVLSAEKAVVALDNTLAELPASRKVLQAQLEEVEAGVTGADLVLSRTTIVAPFTMRLTELSATTGQTVSSGAVLVVGEGLDVLEIDARFPIGGIDPLLPERPAAPAGAGAPPGADPGATAPAEPDAAAPPPETAAGSEAAAPAEGTAPGPRPGGRLARIAESLTPTVRLATSGVEASWPAKFSRFAGVDPLTRTTGVVVQLDRTQRRSGSRDIRLLSGMHVSVDLQGAPKPGCLALPIEAVHDGVVYVADAEDRLRRHEIEVDWAAEAFVCVSAGLEPGDRVVLTELLPAVEGMRLAPTVDEYETDRLRTVVGGDEGAS